MISLREIKYDIIRPALIATGGYSESALVIVTGTGNKESGYKTRSQYNGGPAVGFFQMEKPTYDDTWQRGIKPYPLLEGLIRNMIAPSEPSFDLMKSCDKYAAVMCRRKYMLIKEKLPDASDFVGMANYWKKYYNTYLGKGVVDKYTISLFKESCDA